LTGAPTAAATAATRSVTKAETLGACPIIIGQTGSSQRATLPVIWVGVAAASTKLEIASRDGGAGGAGSASARHGTRIVANTAKRRMAMPAPRDLTLFIRHPDTSVSGVKIQLYSRQVLCGGVRAEQSLEISSPPLTDCQPSHSESATASTQAIGACAGEVRPDRAPFVQNKRQNDTLLKTPNLTICLTISHLRFSLARNDAAATTIAQRDNKSCDNK